MAKFQMKETIGATGKTARLAENTDAAWATAVAAGGSTLSAFKTANNHADSEVGKAVKMAGDSRFALCAAGDQIEGFVAAVEVSTMDSFTIGTVMNEPGYRKEVLANGTQAEQATTPATALAVGDYVVAGNPVAKGTAQSTPVKVCKATTQTGMYHAWRVVSLGSAGTGAVGTTIVIERVS